MFCITERRVGNVIVLKLHGRLSPGDPEIAVRGKVREVACRGLRNVILDLADVSNSDAAIISALLQAREVMRDAGGEVKLLHVTTRMSNLLIIVALHRYFAAFESESEAVASFAAYSGPGHDSRVVPAEAGQRPGSGASRPAAVAGHGVLETV